MERVSSGDIKKLRQWQEDVKKEDIQRHILIEGLLTRIEDMQKKADRSSFVLVLIDGDGMFFLNNLVKQGDPGGDEAAKLLRKSVVKDLQYDEVVTHDTQLVVRVYANMRRLSYAYVEKGILPKQSALYNFNLGFNKAHPLCDFIDVGDHEDAVASKLIETLKLYIYNSHCKHIIFGALVDDRYVSILTSLSIDAEVSPRIRILRGIPFAREYRTMLSRFKRTSFPSVFRDETLLHESSPWRDSHLMSEERNKPSPAQVQPAPVPTNPPYITWRQHKRTESEISKATTDISVDSASRDGPDDISLKTGPIHRNSSGQRIDIPIELEFERQVLRNLRDRPHKVCKNFYLSKCHLGNRCALDHNSVLSEGELAALTYMARCKPCLWGSDCIMADCISGHICPYPGSCEPEKCKFQGMHDIDTEVTNIIPAR